MVGACGPRTCIVQNKLLGVGYHGTRQAQTFYGNCCILHLPVRTFTTGSLLERCNPRDGGKVQGILQRMLRGLPPQDEGTRKGLCRAKSQKTLGAFGPTTTTYSLCSSGWRVGVVVVAFCLKWCTWKVRSPHALHSLGQGEYTFIVAKK